MMVARLRDFGTILSRVHPLVYMSIYLAAIPAFAAGYFCISSELFSPYARFEPAAAQDRQRLATLIENAVHRQLRSRKPDPEIVVDGWHADNSSLQVLSADSADGSAINFKLVIKLSIETPRGTTITFSQIPVSFPGAKGEVVRTPGYNRSYANNVRPTTFKVERSISKQQELAHALYAEVFRSYGESVLVDEALALSERDSKQIDSFLSGIRGDPSAVSGTRGRMLYFSAIVMTTVGFGDVVPLTPRARLLAGIQAVLGVLLAGLFLNAAAYQASNSKRP